MRIDRGLSPGCHKATTLDEILICRARVLPEVSRPAQERHSKTCNGKKRSCHVPSHSAHTKGFSGRLSCVVSKLKFMITTVCAINI
jgi:hypothetical protein